MFGDLALKSVGFSMLVSLVWKIVLFFNRRFHLPSEAKKFLAKLEAERHK